jgi:hypothetical protein
VAILAILSLASFTLIIATLDGWIGSW